MRIAILSDIHDNVWKLDAALAGIAAIEPPIDAMICCGDLCSPFIIHQMGRGFAKPIHVVFGNNDGDLFRITANARHHPHILLHGEWFRAEFDGRRVAVHHFDNIACALTGAGEFDLLCFGHNHVYSMTRAGRTLAVNPGSIMGAAFSPDGARIETASTFMVYDTAAGEARGFEINAEMLVVPR